MAIAARNNDNSREKVTYKWGNSGPSLWQKDNGTVLQSMLRKSDKTNTYELLLRIQSLDENGKFIKREDGTYDNGYFNLSANEVARVAYQLEQMFPANNMDAGTIGGIIVNHISAQTNNGSQLEIVSEENGVYMYISYVTNSEISAEYRHLLNNNQTLMYYNEVGDECRETINGDIIVLKQIFNSAYALVSGLVDSTFECNGFSINGRTESRSGGKVNGGMNRKVRSTLGAAKRAESVSEEDEEVNERPVRKTVSSRITSSSMANLLADDDEEDD